MFFIKKSCLEKIKKNEYKETFFPKYFFQNYLNYVFFQIIFI